MFDKVFFVAIVFTIVTFNVAMYFLRSITGLKWTQLNGAVMIDGFSKNFSKNLSVEKYTSWKKYRLFITLSIIGWLVGFMNGIFATLFTN